MRYITLLRRKWAPQLAHLCRVFERKDTYLRPTRRQAVAEYLDYNSHHKPAESLWDYIKRCWPNLGPADYLILVRTIHEMAKRNEVKIAWECDLELVALPKGN